MSSLHSTVSDQSPRSKSGRRGTSFGSSDSHILSKWRSAETTLLQPSTVDSSLLRSDYLPAPGSDLYCSFDERREALYIVHFVQNLAPLIDICDPFHRFGTELPKLALRNPLLRFSILSFSSRDWLLLNGQEDVWSDKYSSQALQLLIPILDGPVESLDETVLAAIVLLRLYEETTDSDTGTHLLGSTRMLNSASSFAGRGGLGEAASWIVLRQQLYLITTKSQPFRMDLDYYLRSSSFQNSCPESLANRIILLCCRALSPSHDAQGRLSFENWNQLRNDIMHWYDSITWPLKPNASGCLAKEATEGLPNLWIPMPVQVIAYQHFFFALLLLAIYEPQNWVPGKEALLARAKVEDSIQQNLIMICALAISNPKVINASLTAHHILHAYGAFLQKNSHRRAVLDFLRQFPKRSGWPTGKLVLKLQDEWSYPH